MYSELFTVTGKSLHVDVPFIKKLIPRAASDSKKPINLTFNSRRSQETLGKEQIDMARTKKKDISCVRPSELSGCSLLQSCGPILRHTTCSKRVNAHTPKCTSTSRLGPFNPASNQVSGYETNTVVRTVLPCKIDKGSTRCLYFIGGTHSVVPSWTLKRLWKGPITLGESLIVGQVYTG
jgi:hypothetical protein